MNQISKTISTSIVLGLLSLNPLSAAVAHGFVVAAPPIHQSPLLPIASDCVTPPAGLVAWWKGENNTIDSVYHNTASEQNITFTNGEVGQTFVFNGTDSSLMASASSSLNVGLGNGFTIETWINPANLNLQPIFEWNTGIPEDNPDASVGVHLWITTYSADGVTIGPGTLFANLEDTNIAFHTIASAAGILTANTFQHVALTYDKTTGVTVLYRNGVPVATANLGVFTPQTSFDFYMGWRPTGTSAGTRFTGMLDEPSIYNRTLSQAEIQSIYNAGSAGKCALVPAAVPVINNFTPVLGTNGTVVKIYGTNFSPTTASNIVYFGAVQAAVLSASLTNLVVTVPVGATYAPVTVTVNGLETDSDKWFLPTFNGDGSGINATSFAPPQNMLAGNNPYHLIIADIDGDGKPDLVVANVFGSSFSVYRNISTNGLLTADSFAPRIDFTTTAGTYSPFGLAVADVDGDGKLDIVTTDCSSNLVSIFQNTSTPANITFATRVDLVTGRQPQGVAIKDIDSDGHPDLLVANSGDGTVSIYRNLGVTGSLTANSFAPKVDIATGSGCGSVVVGDLDGDGKPDVVTVNSSSGTLSLLRNISWPGSITTNSFATKVDIAVLDGSVQAAIGDLDGDGKLDLVVTSYLPQTLSVLRNTSTVGNLTTNSFAPRIDYPLGGRGHSPAFADLNGDGKPDVAVVTELNSLLSFFQNISTPESLTNNSLVPCVNFATGWNPWGVAIGDLNGDGRPDIVFCNQYDSTISIYQNQTPFSGPPVITMQPTNETAVEGDSTLLSVAATGVGPLAYQWSFNGAILSRATNATLTLTNLHPNQAGNYRVRVANSYGAVTSAVATVTVVIQNLLVYTYSGQEQVTTTGQEFSYHYSGEMFFVPSNTNGTFIGWGVVNGKKQFWVSPFSDYLLVSIPGSANRTYTVLGKAGEAVDANNHPHIWSFLHRGQNDMLTISSRQKFSFPSTLTCDDTHVYPDSQTGKMILREASSIYIFAAQNTQMANNNGQTMADLVNALTASLVKQGYQKQ
jgi:hypothetical protein